MYIKELKEAINNIANVPNEINNMSHDEVLAELTKLKIEYIINKHRGVFEFIDDFKHVDALSNLNGREFINAVINNPCILKDSFSEDEHMKLEDERQMERNKEELGRYYSPEEIRERMGYSSPDYH